MLPLNIDMDALRSFAAIRDYGSFSRAAEHLGRTPPAISLQMKRLQQSFGVAFFQRDGRSAVLTPQGELALQYARRLLELNDDMLENVKGATASGVLRIGFAQDFVETVLPRVLVRFQALYPSVQLEVKVGNSTLESDIAAGRLDVALALAPATAKGSRNLGHWPLHWVAREGYRERPKEPLPLILFEEPCIYRQHAVEALGQANRSWRIAMTTPSVGGLWAAVGAGLGVTVRTLKHLPGLALFSPAGLPDLGSVPVSLLSRSKRRADAPHRRLTEIITEEVHAQHADVRTTSS
jgi:DNA-binding transcriptional LysR family regulator